MRRWDAGVTLVRGASLCAQALCVALFPGSRSCCVSLSAPPLRLGVSPGPHAGCPRTARFGLLYHACHVILRIQNAMLTTSSITGAAGCRERAISTNRSSHPDLRIEPSVEPSASLSTRPLSPSAVPRLPSTVTSDPRALYMSSCGLVGGGSGRLFAGPGVSGL